MPVVTFIKQDITVEVPKGANLRLMALDHGIDLYLFPKNLLNCRGRGLCGTCRVKVDDPHALSSRTLADEKKCGWEGKNYRLACQSQVVDNVVVETNPRKIRGWMNHSIYECMKEQG